MKSELVDIDAGNLPEAKEFLERHPDTSLFMLSNIRAYGARLGDSLYSGNLRGLRQDGQLRAVFCLTRSGSLLAQTAGRAEFAPDILDACAAEPMAIRGVLGEWRICKAIWDRLVEGGKLRPTFESKEISYRLDLTGNLDAGAAKRDEQDYLPGRPARVIVRMLAGGDEEQWDELAIAFQRESGLPSPGTRDQRKVAFTRSAGLRHLWGAFRQDELVSLAAIIALHEAMAQVGSVFTVPDHRRHGLGRAVMTKLIRDSRCEHRLERLFLFTGEENRPARRLYESLGFKTFGHFGLFFGE
jgi:ribosomal protein S18 acetylase RimI-like enzyme